MITILNKGSNEYEQIEPRKTDQHEHVQLSNENEQQQPLDWSMH